MTGEDLGQNTWCMLSYCTVGSVNRNPTTWKLYSSANYVGLYLGGTWFQSLLGHQINWLQFLVVSDSFFRLSNEIVGSLKFVYYPNLPHVFGLINHSQSAVQQHTVCVAGCTTTVGLVSSVDGHENKFWSSQIRLKNSWRIRDQLDVTSY